MTANPFDPLSRTFNAVLVIFSSVGTLDSMGASLTSALPEC